MEAFTDQIMGQLALIVGTVLTGVLTAAGAYVTAWLRRKTKNEKLAKANQVLFNTAIGVVGNLEQTVRRHMKDGRLDPAEAMQIRKQAVNMIKKESPRAVQVLSESVRGSIEEYLGGIVDQANKG